VAVALLIASVLLVSFYLSDLPTPTGYMSISLLDSQKKASNYPTFIVNGVNNTFSLYVQVENHMGENEAIQVQVSATNDINPSAPVYTVEYNGTVNDTKTWETIATITLNDPGNYSVVFELWVAQQNVDTFEFTQEYCVLNVQVAQ
jgi:hypothetical protein